MLRLFQQWLDDPDFLNLPEEGKAQIYLNYFDREMADEEFRGLPPLEQDRIRSNYLLDQDIRAPEVAPAPTPVIPEPPDPGLLRHALEGLRRGIRTTLRGAERYTAGMEEREHRLADEAQRAIGLPETQLTKKRFISPTLKALAETEILETPPEYPPPRTLPGQIAAGVGQVATVFPAYMVNPLLGGGTMFLQIAGDTYENLVKQHVPEDRAFAAGMANALMQTPLEMIGISKIAKVWKPQRFLAKKLKALGEAVGVNVLQEMLQQAPEEIVNAFALNPDEKTLEIAHKLVDDWREITKRTLEAGVVGGGVAGLLGLPGMAIPSKTAPMPTPTPGGIPPSGIAGPRGEPPLPPGPPSETLGEILSPPKEKPSIQEKMFDQIERMLEEEPELAEMPEERPPEEIKAEKEPWEMTQIDYVNQKREEIKKTKGYVPSKWDEIDAVKYEGEHEYFVKTALQEGKPVPVEVLAAYPDLKKEGLPEIEEVPEAERPPIMKTDQGKAVKFRAMADGMQRQIDQKLHPAIGEQNLTRRRARIAAAMREEGEHLQNIQSVFRNMADALEQGTLPESLVGLQNKTQIDLILRKIKAAQNYPEHPEYAGWERITDDDLKRLKSAKITTAKHFEQVKQDIQQYIKGPSEEEKRAKRIKQREAELIGTKIPGFFPTPKAIGRQMVKAAGIREGMSVLEPSAGKGDLAEVIREETGIEPDLIEISSGLTNLLKEKGFKNVKQADFLESEGHYDRIVMNPPFEKGQDIDHVKHAYGQLKPGGRLVSIMSEAPFFRTEKKYSEFRDWLKEVGGKTEPLPEKAFTGKEAFRQTGVKGRIVTIEKVSRAPGEPPAQPPPEEKKPAPARETILRPGYMLLKDQEGKIHAGRYRTHAELLEAKGLKAEEIIDTGIVDKTGKEIWGGGKEIKGIKPTAKAIPEEAQGFVNKIRNLRKREYAQQYAESLWDLGPEPKAEDFKDVTFMARQGVRLQLDEIKEKEKKRPSMEEARGQAQIAAREEKAKRAKKAAAATTIRQWIAATGGINPQDPSWAGEIRDMTTALKGTRKVRAKGFPPGFLDKEAQSFDVRLLEAIEAGWLPPGTTENEFFEAIIQNIDKPSDIDTRLDELEKEYHQEIKELEDEGYRPAEIREAEEATDQYIEAEKFAEKIPRDSERTPDVFDEEIERNLKGEQHRNGLEDLADLSRAIDRGELKLNKTQILDILKRDILNQQPFRTIVNELFQNSLDSFDTSPEKVKSPSLRKKTLQVLQGNLFAEQPPPAWQSPKEKEIHIRMHPHAPGGAMELIFQDNGSGMTPGQVQSAFLTLGNVGTKNETSRGGYGFAKVAFLLYPKEIAVRTHAKTIDGRYMITRFKATREDLYTGQFDLESHETESPDTGTRIQMVFDERYVDKRHTLRGEIDRYIQDLYTPVDNIAFTDNAETVYHGPAKTFGQAAKRHPSIKFSKMASAGSIHFLNQPPDPYAWKTPMGYPIPWKVFNKGLPLQIRTQDIRFAGSRENPDFFIAIDFEKTPRTKDPNYPFLKNRTELLDDLIREIQQRVNPLIQDLNEKALKLEVSQFNTMIKNSPTINGLKVLVPFKDPKDYQKAIELIDENRELLGEIAGIFKNFRKLVGRIGEEKQLNLAITVDPMVHGYRSDPNVAGVEIYAINPFSITEEYLESDDFKKAIDKGRDRNRIKAGNLVHTLVHEFTHNFVQEHYEAYSVRLGRIYSLLTHADLASLEDQADGWYRSHTSGIERITTGLGGLGKGKSRLSSDLEVHPPGEEGLSPGVAGEVSPIHPSRRKGPETGEPSLFELTPEEGTPEEKVGYRRLTGEIVRPEKVGEKPRPRFPEEAIRPGTSGKQRGLFGEEEEQKDLFDLIDTSRIPGSGEGPFTEKSDQYADLYPGEGGFIVLPGSRRRPREGFVFSDPAKEAAWRRSQGIQRDPFYRRLKESLSSLADKITREYEHLPRTGFFAPLRYDLRRLSKQRIIQWDKALRAIASITTGLEPEEFNLFARKVVLEDLSETLTLQKAREEKPRLPWGFDEEGLATELTLVNEAIQGNENIAAALDRRHRLWDALKNDFIAAMKRIGFNVEGKLDRHSYYRHQVLDYIRIKGLFGTGRRLRTPSGRGYLKHRVGSEMDINSNYLQAETEVMAQMRYDMEIAAVIAGVDANYNILDRLKEEAIQRNDREMLKFCQALADQYNQASALIPGRHKEATAAGIYRQMLHSKQAMGFDKLGRLAAEGALPEGEQGQWGALIDALGDNWQENRAIRAEMGKDYDSFEDRVPLREPFASEVIPYLNYLAKRHPEEGGGIAARTIFKGIAEKKKTIQETLKDRYVTWQDLVPEAHSVWQPREGNVFYLADSIPAQLAQKLAEGAFTEIGIRSEDLHKILAMGGRRRQFVLPDPVIQTLDNLTRVRNENPLSVAHRFVIRAWKIWQLISPRRWPKYNQRNLTGDADPTFAGNPHAFLKLPRAADELFQHFFRRKPMTQDLKDWFEDGGMGSTLQAQEMGEINELHLFRRLEVREKKSLREIPAKIWQAYWKGARLTTDFREAVLRYAAYLDYLEQMKESKDGLPKDYGASIPEEVKALGDIKRRAFWLSNDLLGAYDGVGVFGQALRESWIPFWSWKEVNFRRYKQMFQNAAASDRLAAMVGRKALGTLAKTPFVAIRVGRFLIRATAFCAMLQVWNHFFFGDEEDELPEHVRDRPHIVFGRDERGEVRYFSRIGALGDLLEWFGLDAAPQYVDRWFKGKMTLKEIAVDMAQQPANIVVQGIEPVGKTAFELITRRALFPSMFSPTTIRDRTLHVARGLGLENEFLALSKRPSRPYGETISEFFFYKVDPYEAGYRNILEAKQRFLKKLGKYGEGFWLTPRGNAMYSARQALRYDDPASFNYYLEKYIRLYLSSGGDPKRLDQAINQSLENMMPLAGLTKDEQLAFVAGLDAEDAASLVKALVYYVDLLTISNTGGKKR